MIQERRLTVAGPLDATVRKLRAKLSGWDDHELLVVRADDIRRLIAFYDQTKPSTPWLVAHAEPIDIGLDEVSREFRDLLVGASPIPIASPVASESWRNARSAADC